MTIMVVSLCVLGAVAMLICCLAFGREANASRRCSSVTFLSTTEPERLKLKLVKRIQQRRRIVVDPSTTVAKRNGTRTWGVHLSRR